MKDRTWSIPHGKVPGQVHTRPGTLHPFRLRDTICRLPNVRRSLGPDLGVGYEASSKVMSVTTEGRYVIRTRNLIICGRAHHTKIIGILTVPIVTRSHSSQPTANSSGCQLKGP